MTTDTSLRRDRRPQTLTALRRTLEEVDLLHKKVDMIVQTMNENRILAAKALEKLEEKSK